MYSDITQSVVFVNLYKYGALMQLDFTLIDYIFASFNNNIVPLSRILY